MTELEADFAASAEIRSDAEPAQRFVSDFRIGRFEIGSKIGEGTYGIVYVAHDPQLKRLVALKIPRLDAAFRDDLRERFIREGESAGKLTHPNIVTVYEAVAEGPVSLIVSEYIPGPNLAVWKSHCPEKVSPSHAARLIASLAGAVAHAHARGVLHRDIKPSNIILSPDSGLSSPTTLDQFQPKLTDFGLAKLLDSQDLTQSGAMLGTPAYMPPEQISGRSADIGPAVDIYALGMILFELLTGRNPFQRPSVPETVHAVTQEEIPSLRKIRRDIPRDLETICLKCLQKSPGDRYSSARDLEEDLERFLDGRPIRARQVSAWEKAVKWCRRYPALTVSTCAAFALLLTLLIVSRWQYARIQTTLEMARQNQQLAEERALKLQQQAYLDDMQHAGEAWNTFHTEAVLNLLKKHIPQPGQPDVRDFLWWMFWNNLHDYSKVIGTHPGGATAVVSAQSAPYAAFSGGADGVIKVWSIPGGLPLGEMKGHTKGPIHSLELSPDETLLVSAGEDGTVRLWDVASRTEMRVLAGHEGWVACARFSPDGKLIASGGADKLIRIWEVESGRQLRTMTGHTDTIRALAFHPDRDWLASSSEDKTTRLWSVSTGNPADSGGRLPDAQFVSTPPKWTDSLEIPPEGHKLIAGSIGVYSLEADTLGKQLNTFPDPPRIRATTQLLDERLLLARQDSTIRVVRSVERLDETSDLFRGHLGGEVWDLAPLPNDRGFLSASGSGEVRLWNPGTLDTDLFSDPSTIRSADQINWRGDFIVCLSRHGKSSSAEIMHAPTRRIVWSKTFATAKVSSTDAAISSDGSRIFFRQDETLECRSPKDEVLWQKQVTPPIDIVECDPANQIIALTRGESLFLNSMQNGDKLSELRFPRKITQIQFLKDRRQLIVNTNDRVLRILDLARLQNNAPREVPLSTSNSLDSFAFSPDETLVAGIFSDRQTVIWSWPDLKEVARFTDKEGEKQEQAFLVNGGNTLVTRRGEQLRFWYWRQNRILCTVALEHPRVIECNPAGDQIAVEGEHGIRIYDGRPRN
ncbi:MAG: serine/threonine-protein kinase [Planctomycetales bacterium]